MVRGALGPEAVPPVLLERAADLRLAGGGDSETELGVHIAFLSFVVSTWVHDRLRGTGVHRQSGADSSAQGLSYLQRGLTPYSPLGPSSACGSPTGTGRAGPAPFSASGGSLPALSGEAGDRVAAAISCGVTFWG